MVGQLANISAEQMQIDKDEAHLWGYADVSTPEGVRIQADEIHYVKATEALWAEGNVVLDAPKIRVMGSRLEYDVASETGTLYDVVAYFEPDAIVTARKIEKIAEDRVRVEGAVFTSCTQPTPYWSFHLTRGEFHIGHYGYFHNLTMRTGGVPVFYTPYMVWPLKEKRATGLLFPRFGNSDTLGFSVSLPIFWAMARNADTTFYVDGYTKVGPALGADLRWLPTRKGRIRGSAYYINDRVKKQDRYRLGWIQRQKLPGGWNLFADLNFVSDFDYYTDYERDLNQASTPEVISRAEASRNWSYYSLNVRAKSLERFSVGSLGTETVLFSELDQRQLPEFEVRARSRRLGRLPLYLSFVSSANHFEEDTTYYIFDQANVQNSWQRFDLAPEIRAPFSPTTWLDVEPSLGARETWYSRSRDETNPLQYTGESVLRSTVYGNLQINGPRLVRIFDTPKSSFSPQLKHTIEPYLVYRYQRAPSADPALIPVFDEIDAAPQALNDVVYGIRQRLFAKRPAEVETRRSQEKAELFQGLEDPLEGGGKRRRRDDEFEDDDEARQLKGIPVSERLNPVEVASLTISQNYTFHPDQARSYKYGVWVNDFGFPQAVVTDSRRYSPVTVDFRYNASRLTSVDVRYLFDILNSSLSETVISSSLRMPERGYLRFSWYRRNPPNPLTSQSDQVRFFGGVETLDRRLGLEVQWNYDLEESQMLDQHYRVRYYTQCCGFLVEYFKRDFVGNQRQEIRFSVDLRGIGKFLELRQGFGGVR